MADKPAPEFQTDKKTVEQITYLLAGLFLLAAIATALLAYLESLRLDASFFAGIMNLLRRLWSIWKILAAILSILAIAGIIHNSRKLQAINIEEQKVFNPKPEPSDQLSKIGPPASRSVENERWKNILKYMNSDNVSDRQFAVIEADVMLEELLQTLGLHGDSVGEMLKSADKNEFLMLEEAWEAHKARNAVVHAGANFQLNERETKRVVALFEKVFKEFGII